MTKKNILTTTLFVLVGFTGCTSSPKLINDRQTKDIEKSFEHYKKFKSHKAMALAMDKKGKYMLGYSFDCASEESAKRIALDKCTKANRKAKVPADAQCAIFAIENKIVSTK